MVMLWIFIYIYIFFFEAIVQMRLGQVDYFGRNSLQGKCFTEKNEDIDKTRRKNEVY